MKPITIIAVLVLLSGCAATTIDPVVDHYNSVKSKIVPGMELSEFLAIFDPYQNQLHQNQRKPAERFTKNGSIYDVYYIRSARIPDGATTDDEFTPYIFINGKLAEIGWASIGGMNRTSQDVAREKAEIEKAKASATKIEQNIEQSTEVKRY